MGDPSPFIFVKPKELEETMEMIKIGSKKVRSVILLQAMLKEAGYSIGALAQEKTDKKRF